MNGPSESVEELADWLVERIAALSGRSVSHIDRTATFAGNGLDSVRVAELASQLQQRWAQPIDPAVFFEYPTVADLARALVMTVASVTGPGPSESTGRPVAPRGGDRSEPVAVVGLACRMPGAPDAAAFWDLLVDGSEAIGPVPVARFRGLPGADDPELSTLSGGFLPDVAGFDAAFFGIGHDEALRMDPQQRLLLEVCWEAVEDSGQRPGDLRGSRTGVFVGISTSDYAYRQSADPGQATRHTATGSASAVAANRISYAFDWRGPSLAVDTACSASLVSVHLAVGALRSGECDRAVVGGVNLILGPGPSLSLLRAGMLSPDGRCKPFSAAADGYGRGEGCGVLVLKRLSDAQADGDRIYALVRGSAVNQDGGSNGLTAPNPGAQRAVLRAAYADAGLPADAAEYVECHGTGTPLGDPIEVSALAQARGGDTARPAFIGSVKGNIGHLEAAAGVAGVIKTVLALHHGIVPPSLHADEPNPRIPFDRLNLTVAATARPWPASSGSADPVTDPSAAAPGRCAGVSGFGFGGTNAHLVLTGAPGAPVPSAHNGLVVVPLAARSRSGLLRLARAAARHAATSADPVGFAATMACRRETRRAHRAVAVAADGPALAVELAALADQLEHAGATGPASAGPPEVSFVFSGQGSALPTDAVALMRAEPLFRSVVRRCDDAVADQLGWSIEAVLAGEAEVDVTDTSVAQILIVTVQLAVAELWRSLGVRPAAVVGHSVGEISAAVVAGILSLDAGMRLVVLRGTSMAQAGGDGDGGMLVVGLDEESAQDRYGGRVAVAAVNAPDTVVLSGTSGVIDDIAAELDESGVYTHRLATRYAFHSGQMASAAAEVAAGCADLETRPASVPFYSTVTGGPVSAGQLCGAQHWAANVRERVRFADAVRQLTADHPGVLLEIGPVPSVQGALRRSTAGSGATVLSSASGVAQAHSTLLRTAADLYQLGVPVDWNHCFPTRRQVVSTPPPPWDHERFWLEPAPQVTWAGTSATLLGDRLELADLDNVRVWQRIIGLASLPALADHRVGAAAIFPAAGYLVQFAAAAATMPGQWTLTGVDFLSPLNLDEPVVVQCGLTIRGPEQATVTVHARPAGADAADWQRCASALLVPGKPAPAVSNLADAVARCPTEVSTAQLYAELSRGGLNYGDGFRGLRQVHAGYDEAVAELTASADPVTHGARLVDSALHAIAATGLARQAAGGTPAVPVSVDEVTFWSDPATVARCRVVVREVDGDLVADVELVTGEGGPAGQLLGLRLRPLAVPRPAAIPLHHYQLHWRVQPVTPQPRAEARWLVLHPTLGCGLRVAHQLAEAAGPTVTLCPVPADADPERIADLLTELDFQPTGIIHLPSESGEADGGIDADMVSGVVESALNLLRAVALRPARVMPRTIFVTWGSQSLPGRPVSDPFGAMVWGAMRTVPLEHPLLDVACVDLDPDGDPVSALRAELTAPGTDMEIGYAGAERFVRRIVPVAAAHYRRLVPDPEGVYLITGGSGGLGVQAAMRLAQRGARHLVLLSRTGRAEDLPETLLQRCPYLRVVRADVADREQLAAVLDSVRADGRPLRGVIHAAGVLRNQAMLELTAQAVRDVLVPKVLGGWHLHQLTRDDPLDWFVLFASAAGVLGSPGQANYAAANSFLDALARYRSAAGSTAVSVDWGPWAEVGMASDWDPGLDRELRTAATAIAPQVGLDALETLAVADQPQVVMLPFDLRDLVQFYPSDVGRSFLAEVTNAETDALRSIGVGFSARPELSSPYTTPRNGIEQRIAAIWQKAMGIEPIGVLDNFFELGGDSVLANQILVDTNHALGVRIRPDGAFGDFTIANHAVLAEAAMLAALDEMSEDEAARLLGDDQSRSDEENLSDS
ncbi:SDR family NAD(P)-dependent oxidoreductase [Micromonospora sp. LOL_021]|uniref:SDR family NAD(P)-dependent oxidoreductase n=1 Tax=Micromonospora sp. LOL_021 TaxID=3345417 RepID=UPI003A8B9574